MSHNNFGGGGAGEKSNISIGIKRQGKKSKNSFLVERKLTSFYCAVVKGVKHTQHS